MTARGPVELEVVFGPSRSLTREPLEHIEEHGFAIERVDRWAWGIMERVVARRKG